MSDETVCGDAGLIPECRKHCEDCVAGRDCLKVPHPPSCGVQIPADPVDSLLGLLHANAAGTASRADVENACRGFKPEFQHTSSCGIMFRQDRKCDCAVGEVARLRQQLALERAGLVLEIERLRAALASWQEEVEEKELEIALRQRDAEALQLEIDRLLPLAGLHDREAEWRRIRRAVEAHGAASGEALRLHRERTTG